MKLLTFPIWYLSLMLFLGAGINSVSADVHMTDYENELLSVLGAIEKGQLELALEKANLHVEKYPKSRVGHLLKADILVAMSSQLNEVGEYSPLKSDVLNGLKHQIKNRWKHNNHHTEMSTARFPSSLIVMGKHKHVMVTDMASGRLYLYRNESGKPSLIRDYYLTVGSSGYGKQVEGDNKTPIGVYSVYQFIDDTELPDLYGSGAFPVDYPNRYDRYKKRTGYGIWLHGTPSNTYARSPWASEGCFVLSNADFEDIQTFISVEERTPVILSESIDWVTLDELQNERQKYLSLFQKWKADWESLDTDAYLSHYSENEFNFGTTSFNNWSSRKRAVNNNKTFVQVDFDIDSLFLYPGESDMFIVRFTQRYMSNNYHGETKKEQYWQRNQQGEWKILYEG